MKKPHLIPLLAVTCLFVAFSLGFFLGRNKNHETVYLSAISVSPSHHTFPNSVSQIETHSVPVSFPVNINTAELEQLCTLPGIGETLGHRIINYREIHGAFDRPEELMNVEGIGAGKLESLLDYITVGG